MPSPGCAAGRGHAKLSENSTFGREAEGQQGEEELANWDTEGCAAPN
jgi:hypothetical protein